MRNLRETTVQIAVLDLHAKALGHVDAAHQDISRGEQTESFI
jgi:hypothetical protein